MKAVGDNFESSSNGVPGHIPIYTNSCFYYLKKIILRYDSIQVAHCKENDMVGRAGVTVVHEGILQYVPCHHVTEVWSLT